MTDPKQTSMVKCEDRCPEKSGIYKIKNNTHANNGIGFIAFNADIGKWLIHPDISDWYAVLGWWENKELLEN